MHEKIERQRRVLNSIHIHFVVQFWQQCRIYNELPTILAPCHDEIIEEIDDPSDVPWSVKAEADRNASCL